ncbi:MAG: DMT family transporter [Nitrospirota bacterium]
MTAPALGIACAVVTCLAWGVADYLAARVTRRVGEIGALLRIQLVGVPVLLSLWAILRAPLPDTRDLVWITPAAGCFVVGYLAFFYGLRVGAISLVSPISSAGAAVPVLAGIGFFGEAASGARLGGIGLTLIGICVLSADPGAIGALAPIGRRQGIRAGVVTLLAWGSGTALLLPAVRSAGAFVPVATLRLEVLAIISTWWLIGRSRSSGTPREPASSASVAAPRAEPRNGLWGVVVAAALLDLTAFFAYGVALRDAPAAVAAPIASAYPLVTILIARHRLQERLAGREWLGVGLTLAGVGLLGTGCCETP